MGLSESWHCRVYPRVCGGATSRSLPASPATGLSPRVRGSLRVFFVLMMSLGSIPACAGEPATATAGRDCRRVYPRVCGGAGSLLSSAVLPQGLSPRVRGSRLIRKDWLVILGSIPACAGEPLCRHSFFSLSRVYPRVCGGARDNILGAESDMGLSPRVRGSRGQRAAPDNRPGSIPACAGEPLAAGGNYDEVRVYPRVCGGASISGAAAIRRTGLSPRVRGSRLRDRDAELLRGSIPACAGEPAG